MTSQQLESQIRILTSHQQRILDAQEDYCSLHLLPNFLPEDGLCFFCKKDLTLKFSKRDAENKHITGCPSCNKSFCD